MGIFQNHSNEDIKRGGNESKVLLQVSGKISVCEIVVNGFLFCLFKSVCLCHHMLSFSVESIIPVSC